MTLPMASSLPTRRIKRNKSPGKYICPCQQKEHGGVHVRACMRAYVLMCVREAYVHWRLKTILKYFFIIIGITFSKILFPGVGGSLSATMRVTAELKQNSELRGGMEEEIVVPATQEVPCLAPCKCCLRYTTGHLTDSPQSLCSVRNLFASNVWRKTSLAQTCTVAGWRFFNLGRERKDPKAHDVAYETT